MDYLLVLGAAMNLDLPIQLILPVVMWFALAGLKRLLWQLQPPSNDPAPEIEDDLEVAFRELEAQVAARDASHDRREWNMVPRSPRLSP